MQWTPTVLRNGIGHVTLWNGSDTSLSAPTTPQYFEDELVEESRRVGNTVTIAKGNEHRGRN